MVVCITSRWPAATPKHRPGRAQTARRSRPAPHNGLPASEKEAPLTEAQGD